MFTKVSVLVPTRGRVKHLKTLLDSFEQTADGRAELIFRIDNDDSNSYEYLRGENHVVIVGSQGNGYEDMPSFFNELSSFATGDVLLCGNDDMVFKTLGWASMILDAASQFPDGLFDIGVTTHNETHYPFSIVSRKAVEAMGFIWDPRIFWGDIFLRDVMAAFGRCVMLPSVEIEHAWQGHAPDHPCFVPRGDAYWFGVHATAVADAVEKLLVLRD